MSARSKALAVVAIIAMLLLADAGGWLLTRSPSTDCLPEAFAGERRNETRAIRTVVQPWRGPHHVYGLFVLPEELRESKRYALTISVKGALRYCLWVERSRWHRWQFVGTEEGRHVVRQYVPTRVALWFLINGRLDDLRAAENWAIVFSDRQS